VPIEVLKVLFALGLWSIAFMSSAPPLAGADLLDTATSGMTCQRCTEDGLVETRCKGPPGYVAVILDRDQIMRMDYGRSDDPRVPREPDGSGLRWRGVGRLVGDRVEWRFAQARPFAAIVRIFTAGADDRSLEQFLVAKVTPTGACELARVDARDANALGTARDLRHRAPPSSNASSSGGTGLDRERPTRARSILKIEPSVHPRPLMVGLTIGAIHCRNAIRGYLERDRIGVPDGDLFAIGGTANHQGSHGEDHFKYMIL